SGFPGDPVQIRRRVVDDVFANKAFEWTKQTPGPYPSPILPSSLAGSPGLALGLALGVVGIVLAFTLIFIPPLGLALVFALAALGVVAAAGFAAVSFLASRDPVIIRDDVQEHTARLVQTEDRIVQNEMSSVIYIKRP